MLRKCFINSNYGKILEYINGKSQSLTKVMKKDSEWNYLLIRKNISHSDLINSGKRNGKDESLDKNYLYYITTKEMEELEEQTGKQFESAKQSNIHLPSEFYEFLEIKELTRRKGPQKEKHKHPIISEYADVFLVNDSLKYFDIDFTKKIFEKLNKNPQNWKYEDYKLKLSDGNFTSIQLSHAIHGIGTSDDKVFHDLRRSIFKNDSIILLLRKNNTRKEVYILLEKNPKFYTIMGISNERWEKYLDQSGKKEVYELLKRKNLNEFEYEKTRKNQNKWRNLLAEEMMNYTTNENEIFCPLTYITANFNDVGTLFRASHIKEFSKCSIDEAFDINNGIIMVANADALFDKHLITIDENGNIIFSYLLENEYKLKQELRLTEKVFKSILNETRLKYLKYHKAIFYKKEEKRKTKDDADDIEYNL